MNGREDQSRLCLSEVQQRLLLLLPEEKVPAHRSHPVPWHRNWSQLWYKLSQGVGWALDGPGPALGA